MHNEQLLTELQAIFRDVLDQPDLILKPEDNARTVEDWDSLAHISIVTAIQRKYAIKFALGELQNLKNVGDMVELVQAKLGEK